MDVVKIFFRYFFFDSFLKSITIFIKNIYDYKGWFIKMDDKIASEIRDELKNIRSALEDLIDTLRAK